MIKQSSDIPSRLPKFRFAVSPKPSAIILILEFGIWGDQKNTALYLDLHHIINIKQ